MAKRRGKSRIDKTGRPRVAPPPVADDAGPRRTAGGRAPWIAALILALATLGAYWQVHEQGFIEFDDQKYVEENSMVQKGLTGESVAWAMTTLHASNWHPLTWLSHMADWELFGLDPGAHHMTNLLLHVGSVLLLLAVMLRMTGRLGASVFVAGLFALHPLHVESVAWLSERKDVLSTFFWMATLWAYLRYATQRGGVRPWGARYAITLLLFALGLLAKPMLVTLPFVLLLLDYWPLGRLDAGQSLEAANPDRRQRRQASLQTLLVEKAPLFALAAVSSYMTVKAQRAGGATASLEAFTLGERVANALTSYAVYIWKTIWPQKLAVFYPHPGTPPAWQVAVAALLLAAITWMALAGRRRRPYLLIGWLWYLGTLVPVIGLVQVGGQAIADRYTYIPTIGLFLMVAVGAAELLAVRPRARGAAAAAAALILIALGVRTWFQVGYWDDSITLFERSVAITRDNYKLNNTLGGLYIESGDLPTARRYIEASIEQLPGWADSHVNLGLLELTSGNVETAIAHYRKAISFDPDHAQGLDNLGNALAITGRVQEAIPFFERALRLDADRPATLSNLGTALAQSGRPDEAIRQFEAALEIAPGLVNAHAGLAEVLAQLGRADEAVARFETALRLDPSYLQAHFNLGRLLAQRNDLAGAKRHFEAVIRVEPGLPEPHFYLGLAHLYSGDVPGALAEQRILTRIDPPMAEHLLGLIQSGG